MPGLEFWASGPQRLGTSVEAGIPGGTKGVPVSHLGADELELGVDVGEVGVVVGQLTRRRRGILQKVIVPTGDHQFVEVEGKRLVGEALVPDWIGKGVVVPSLGGAEYIVATAHQPVARIGGIGLADERTQRVDAATPRAVGQFEQKEAGRGKGVSGALGERELVGGAFAAEQEAANTRFGNSLEEQGGGEVKPQGNGLDISAADADGVPVTAATDACRARIGHRGSALYNAHPLAEFRRRHQLAELLVLAFDSANEVAHGDDVAILGG